jgi:hypothetical protein
MFGVKKSKPVRPALLKARASVEMSVAIWSTRSSSNAAEVKIGWGKEVA